MHFYKRRRFEVECPIIVAVLEAGTNWRTRDTWWKTQSVPPKQHSSRFVRVSGNGSLWFPSKMSPLKTQIACKLSNSFLLRLKAEICIRKRHFFFPRTSKFSVKSTQLGGFFKVKPLALWMNSIQAPQEVNPSCFQRRDNNVPWLDIPTCL